jgi:hypothetical protein
MELLRLYLSLDWKSRTLTPLAKFFLLSWSRNFLPFTEPEIDQFRVHKNPPLDPIFNQKNSVYLQMFFLLLWRYSPNLGLGLTPWNSPFHFGFVDLRQSVGLLGRVISWSQGLYLYTNTEKRKHTNTKHPCPLSGIRTRLPRERRQCMF